MKGFSQVDVGLLNTVLEVGNEYLDTLTKHLQQTKRDAHEVYAKGHLGKRYFWLWFGLVPCNEKRSKKWAIERFDRWYPIDHYGYELEWSKQRIQQEHNIEFMRNYIRSHRDYIEGIVTRCVNENNIMLEISELQQLHRFIAVYSNAKNNNEFPISFKK